MYLFFNLHIQRVMEILVQTLTGDRSPLENYIYRKNVRAKLHRLGARSLQSRLASNRSTYITVTRSKNFNIFKL